MKTLKIVGFGVVLWSISLLWPALNERLTGSVMLLSVIGLVIIKVLLILDRFLTHHRNHDGDKTNDMPQSHPSNSLPLALPH